MAEVTGLTAAAMQAIADASIVSGTVDGGGHLQLTTHGGDTIDAGGVVGPTGATGATGATGSSGDAPSGAIMMFGSVTPPTGWLVCDGSAVSRSVYSALFAAIGTSFGVGDGSTTFNLPNMVNRMPRQDNANLGVSGGTTPSSHTHAVDGGSPAAAAHIVLVSGVEIGVERISTGTWTQNFVGNGFSTGSSSDTRTLGAKVVGNTAASTDTLPPYLNVSFIIKT